MRTPEYDYARSPGKDIAMQDLPLFDAAGQNPRHG